MFHPDYKNLTDKLPLSLLKRARKRLLTYKQNPVTLEQITGKHERIETHLRDVLESYENEKAQRRIGKIDPAALQQHRQVLRAAEEKAAMAASDWERKIKEQESEIQLTIADRLTEERQRLVEEAQIRLSTTIREMVEDNQERQRNLEERIRAENASKFDEYRRKLSKLQGLERENQRLAKINKRQEQTILRTKAACASKEQKCEELHNKLFGLRKERQELAEVVKFKDQKILHILSEPKAAKERSPTMQDPDVEPETYFSQAEKEMWGRRRIDAKLDLEARKRFTFRSENDRFSSQGQH
jgi:hypothetical protein